MASKLFWSFFGPKLFRIHKSQNNDVPGRNYVPRILELYPDKVLSTFHAMWSITLWTSPLITGYLYKKGYFSQEGVISLMRLAASFAVVYTTAYVIRGIGRISNVDYRDFITVLIEARNQPTPQNKKNLAHYDFEFWAWQVDFRFDEGSSRQYRTTRAPVNNTKRAQAIERSSLICKILGYLAIHSFGRRMVYPGGTSLMGYLLGNMLTTGRATLVEEKKGKRAKVLTEDGNEIDTMFVDNRRKSRNGNTLVITFEGNAGFYEMGCSDTPRDLKYSVLSWNHPGFGGSSGVPLPAQEQNAIDAVMQYAIVRLGFEPCQIGLFAWSIGGYTCSWLARTYPDVKFVIMDATFDDIVPLAIPRMPASWKNLVILALRSHMDLNVADQILDYPGPILLIRRTRDEVISTESPNNGWPLLSSNRGNHLLVKILKHRYPTIVDDTTLPLVEDFLALNHYQQIEELNNQNVNHGQCRQVFANHVATHGTHFPMRIDVGDVSLKRKLALYLVTTHMDNFDSTHCTPLPNQHFRMPWSPGPQPDQ